MSVHDVDLSLSYRWYLLDLEKILKNRYKVFSCFAGGGGSSMGYKLAGYNVLGGLEIDKEMALNYKTNLKPKYFFIEDIRKFKERKNLPEELFNLDILDGSPPCSVFSMIGKREKGWNIEKVFKEGQAKQRLDDLFFHFLDLAKRLKPKVIIAENVQGLIQGNARGYVVEIFKKFKAIGYNVQLFLLDSATMGIPQQRKRIFFIAKRNDLNLSKLKLQFNYPLVSYKEIEEENPKEVTYIKSKITFKLWRKALPGKSFSHVHITNGSYSRRKLHPLKPVPTIIADIGTKYFHYKISREITTKELILAGSFPLDYQFIKEKPQYIIGMSVPPLMICRIAEQVKNQWLDKIGR